MNKVRKETQAPARRGNTIVLVIGILVLLVIIATAFVVRTQAGRTTSAAQQSVVLKDDVVRHIADDLASEVSLPLFVRQIDVSALGSPLNLRVGSNAARLPLGPAAIPFIGDEQDFVNTSTGLIGPPFDGRADYIYNHPSYAVIPFTNWPDPSTPLDNGGGLVTLNWTGGNGASGDWPFGPGNPTAAFPAGSPLHAEHNPLGDPGFNDFRAGRDIEPQRWDTNADGIPDAFSHWRHMSNIARPDNGWRIVFDISDVGDSNGDGYGLLVTDLNIPVEQFLPITHAYLNTVTGDSNLVPLGIGTAVNNDFINNWGNWLGVSANGMNGYIQAYRDPTFIPPNFVRLRDINANGTILEDGERPQDEFAGPGINPTFPTAAPRWQVGRVLTDTDGDGYTDSFWFLAPSSMQSGIRTIVGVSIIDNQGMLDINAATRYMRNDPTGTPQKTRGLTPTDLALVGQGTPQANGNFNGGLYDNWQNWFTNAPEVDVRYDVALGAPGNLWHRHLTEVGLTNAAGVPLEFPNTATRLDYWRRSASRPLSADPQSRYTPFTLSDELELRMYAGQNYPWIASRLEWSTASNVNGGGYGPFRGQVNREESSEYIDQLNNFQYARDIRHRSTVINGVRNDIAAPWLWLYGPNIDADGDAAVTLADQNLDLNNPLINAFDRELLLRGMRKFDLRLPYHDAYPGFQAVLVGDWDDPILPRDYELTPNTTALQFGMAARDRLARALMDGDNLPGNRGTYYGNSLAAADQTAELAAAYAANIAQWRDREIPAVATDLSSRETSRLLEAVPVPPTGTTPNPTARFMGMEPQPFLVEAFIGHIYAEIGVVIPAVDVNGTPYTNAGQRVVADSDDLRSTVIVVQIANPYSRPIDLDDPDVQYQVRVFGQEFDLVGLGVGPLMPASEDNPATLVLYAIKDDITLIPTTPNLETKWVNFTDIDSSLDLPPNSLVVRVVGRWDVDSRGTYDTDTSIPAIDIRRRESATDPWVTIDRIDPPSDRRFGDLVNDMGRVGFKPEDYVGPPAAYDAPDVPTGSPYPGHDIGIDGSEYDRWVQWARATRAWGVDVDGDNEIDFNEVSPRYVFGDYATCVAAGDPAIVGDVANTGTVLHEGNRYKDGTSPDTPWFTRPYTREAAAGGANVTIDTNKPTFFNFNHVVPDFPNGVFGDPAMLIAANQWSFPDKGWYAQKGTYSPDDPVIVPIQNPPPLPAPQNERAYATPFPFQMLHKDGDFEQVGELLNVFLYGHKLRFTSNLSTGTFDATGPDDGTLVTFSEYLSEAASALTGFEDPNLRYRTNRLLLTPTSNGGTLGQIIGIGDPTVIDDPRHAVPDLPAGIRVIDSFVCDGFGCEPLFDDNGSGSVLDEAEFRTLYNAKNFDGSATPGLININTAPLEVLRCLPMMYRMVHETGGSSPGTPYLNATGEPLVTTAPNAAAHLPRVMIPESIEQYRERHNGDNAAAFPTGQIGGPNYEVRVNPRGFATPAELLWLDLDGQAPFMARPASNGPDTVYSEYWRMDFGIAKSSPQVGAAAAPGAFWQPDPYAPEDEQGSMRISTDRQDIWDPSLAAPGGFRPDYVAGDAEEANALFAGISNMITTRSDVFTVYFKVRTFRQNTSVSPPRWDATNPEFILDDSRYVMLVDRSGVNKPGDQPKILYMEKLPN